VERNDLSRNLIINIADEADGEMTVGGVADQPRHRPVGRQPHGFGPDLPWLPGTAGLAV
jgi:hypothetical protein